MGRPRRRLGWRAAAAAALAAVGLVAGCGTLDEKQREWVLQPSKSTWWGGAVAAEGMDDVWIDFHSREADAPVLLYLHGARWDVRSSANRMRRMHELGFSVLGIDYRGFGRSTDMLPPETMAYEDARAAWDWLAARHPQARRYVFGHSLGGAIAVHLAGEVDDAAGPIVEGSFTSIPDVVSTLKWGWLPVGPLVTQRFDTGRRIERVRVPVLVDHGSADGLIHPELGRVLYERAPPPKRFVLVEGGSHHNTNAVGQPLYRDAVAELFGVRATP